MYGGIVIETIDIPDMNVVWVNCRDTSGDVVRAIYIVRTPASRSISEGDLIWWKGGSVFWTPSTQAFSDMKLQKVGYSGVERPKSNV